jgi:5-methylcytosine-specific restriction enzyme subunit McrC
LNSDYASLHGLCRLLLSGSAPLSAEGDLVAPPFLLDMATLFEVFVYRWMELHLPETVTVKSQERVVVDESSGLEFRIDLVLHDEAGAALCTLDTKHKRTTTADTRDIQQAVAYAVSVGASEAVLVYPSNVRPALEVCVGGVHVTSASFELGCASIDAAGAALLASLPTLTDVVL